MSSSHGSADRSHPATPGGRTSAGQPGGATACAMRPVYRTGVRVRESAGTGQGPGIGSASVDCLFCRIVSGETSAHHVLDEPEVVGFLDARPVFKGHVLLVPRTHLDTLSDLPESLFGPLFGAAQRVSDAVRSALGAQGSFVALNN